MYHCEMRADLNGIYPSGDKPKGHALREREVFTYLLAKMIYSVVNPIK